ncbi:MAG: PorT family protein [Chitinophagaceae bacterium]|nr:PorT family protein [Chitinophagaceae bacterium]
MKLFNHISSTWRRSIMPLTIFALVIHGCCIPPGAFEAKNKPCNCGDDKKSLAENEPQDKETQDVSLPIGKGGGLSATSVQGWPSQWPAAKVEEDKKLPLGIKAITTSVIAGPNVSFKSVKDSDDNGDNKPGIGFQIGVGSSYHFSKEFAVRTSLLLKQNNAREVYSFSTPGEPGGNPIVEEFKSNYSFSYLSVPILAEWKLSKQLTAVAGPELNYLLGASVKTTGYGDEDKTKITDNAVRFGAGVQLGLRYRLPGSPIGFQLLYDHRLSRLNEKNESDYNPGGGSYESPAWRMSGFQLGMDFSLCNLLEKK